MCYRDNISPLYFNGIHTACICGDNGNGKSALIDAMTWALWGRTRARSDDEIVNSGQAEMEVEFDFAVGQQTYRIIRKYSKPKRVGSSGRTILEFQIGIGDGFGPITGNSLILTQEKIKEVLRMDYDTFRNSAYLSQGRADEFTIKKATERKQVLADILRLSLYDGLEGKAKEVVKAREEEKGRLANALSEINSELARKPALQAELGKTQKELSEIEHIVREKKSRLDQLRQQKEAMVNKGLQLTQLEEHIGETERNLERWDEQIGQYTFRLKEYNDIISQRTTIEDGYAQFTESKRIRSELEQKLGVIVRMNEGKSQLEKAIAQAQTALLTDHAVFQNKIKELEINVNKLTQLKIELQQARDQLRLLSVEEETLQEKRQISQQLKTQLHYLESNIVQLEWEAGEIREKLKLLLSEGDARCPLCETELGIDRLHLIEVKYEDDRRSNADSLKLNRAELANKKPELELLESEVSRLERRLNQDRAMVHGRTSILDQQIVVAEESGKRLNEERKKLAVIEQRLATKDFAVSEQQALAKLESELANLNYDSQQHERVRHQIASLEQYEISKGKLDEADRLYNQVGEDLVNAEKVSRELRQGLDIDNDKKQSLTVELRLLPQLIADLAQMEAEYQTLTIKQKQAEEEVWAVKGKVDQCFELEERRKEKDKLMVQALKQEEIYRELAEAFGKRGVQALLIEVALPEIEIEANNLLSRMTDNRMHVKIETQRETKKGELRETLDIRINDGLETRNYEMFSGGEAFRINFALRIALSKLLARRAGAPLPTLIIDEGFGTQDSDGIEKLKEAINSIQDDFEKILVITHIEELKDAFPTRIDIVKDTEGSSLQLR
jgi:exonuclease SbcC